MNAYVYARYSSDKQNEASIEAQVRACREYAESHNVRIISVYADEAVSGKGSATSKRLQYQKMLRDIKKHEADVILIHQYDRIARNLGEHVNLEARLSAENMQLIAVNQDYGQTKEGKLVKTIMWGLSEYYIDNLSTEVKKGHRETALKGRFNGGVAPFGYDIVDQAFVVNDIEADYVRRMFQYAAEQKGFSELLAEMKAAGIKGKRGKEIKYTQVYEILRAERYTGVYLYSLDEEKKRSDRRAKPKAIRIEGAIPAIIEKDLFEEVQNIMDERKQTGKASKHEYLCSGLVYCHCGAKMHAITTERKGHIYQRYVCSKKCGGSTILVEKVDNAAKEYLHTLLTKENQEAIVLAILRYASYEKSNATEFNREVKQKILDKQKQYDTLMGNMMSTALPPEIVADMAEKMKTLKNEMSTLSEVKPSQDFTPKQILDWLDHIKNAPDQKAIRLLIERIDIDNIDKNKPTTEINITSTLSSVVGKLGCGGRI